MQTPVVICGYKRSPFHFANKGALAGVRPDDIAAAVIKALVKDTGVKAEDIEDLLMGCAFPEAEQGFNLARIVVNLAGLPAVSVPCGRSGEGLPIGAQVIGRPFEENVILAVAEEIEGSTRDSI